MKITPLTLARFIRTSACRLLLTLVHAAAVASAMPATASSGQPATEASSAQQRSDRLLDEGDEALRTNDHALALVRFGEAAALGNTRAMLEVGRLHESGTGTRRNADEALRLYRAAIQRGNVEAGAHLALLLLREGRTDAAMPAPLKTISSAAEKGITRAFYAMGWLHQHGVGMPRDEALAAEWFEKAARSGDEDAQVALALQYLSGNGLPESPRMAAIWLDEPARRGHVEAQARLGFMFRDGWGVERDEQEAFFWLGRAADSGHLKAMIALAQLQSEGRGAIRAEPEKALPLLRRAAHAGDPGARFLLGRLLAEEQVSGADREAGVQLIREAAAHGVAAAKEWLESAIQR